MHGGGYVTYSHHLIELKHRAITSRRQFWTGACSTGFRFICLTVMLEKLSHQHGAYRKSMQMINVTSSSYFQNVRNRDVQRGLTPSNVFHSCVVFEGNKRNEVKVQCGGHVRPSTYVISIGSWRISVKFGINILIFVYICFITQMCCED
jgi:hypothetical protein